MIPTLKRQLKWVGLISLMPLGALVIFLIYIAYQEIVASSSLKQKLNEMRQAGEPYDNGSMALFFEKMTHKEGTAAWSEVLELFVACSEMAFAKDMPSIGTGKFPLDLRPGSIWQDEPRVAEFLNEVRPEIKRIHVASEFPTPVWMPLHFDGYLTLLQPAQESRFVAAILDLDATHALYHKDGERALKAMIAMRAVADAFDWSCFPITQYIVCAIHYLQWQCIHRSLDMDVWDDEQLVKLSTQVNKPFDIVGPWKAGYSGQTAMYLASLDNLSEVFPSKVKDNPLLRLPVLPSTRLEVLRTHESLQRCVDQGEEGLAERAEATFNKQKNRRGLSLTTMHLDLFLPYDELIPRTVDELETARRLTLTAIAVKRFHLKNNRWPESITELSDLGLTSQDWTTTKREPFGYEVDSNRAFVWSHELKKGQGVAKTRPMIDPSSHEVSNAVLLNHMVSIR